jgi:hypothetical protein
MIDRSLGAAPLDEVEVTVRDALARGDDERLRVLGYGEISLVLGWPSDSPVWACKRLPAFSSEAAADRYRDQFDRYLVTLSERGIEPVPSAFRTVPGPGGVGRIGYVVQPVLPDGSLGPDVLRSGDRPAADALLRSVVDAVPHVVDQRTGLDGQLSNWAVVEGRIQYLDVSTPMVFDPAGRLTLDLDLFLAAYPWALRAPIRRFVAPGVIGAYRDARHVLVDLAANLLKERLDDWLPTVLDLANEHVGPAVTGDEVRRYYRSDARLWEVMLRLRRADRWWQQRVRRRDYPFLLPGPIRR